MSSLLPKPFSDIIREAQDPDHMLVIVFEQSTSKSYELAVGLAQGATKYSRAKLYNKEAHAAVFAKKKEDVARAAALLKLVGKWKSCKIFTGTQVMAPSHYIIEVLECYLKSIANRNYKAHCHTVYKDLDLNDVARPLRAAATTLQLADQARGKLTENDKPRFLARLMEKYKAESNYTSPTYLLPCQQLSGFFRWGVLYNEQLANIPIEDRLQALAIKRGCEWCPNLKIEDFKELGET